MSMALTDTNYHSVDANREYMSASLYKKFMRCEAATMAELNGEWTEPVSDALLVGSYVHAAIEGTLDKFKEEHPEMYSTRGKTKGELKASFQQADKMVQTLMSDPLIAEYLEGRHEQIITAELFGCVWKGKLDLYDIGRERISDIKTTPNLHHKEWDPVERRYLSWIEHWGHMTQLAIYSELERRWSGSKTRPDVFLIAVTKEDIPDKGIFTMTSDDIELELSIVGANMPCILRVWNGVEEPRRCETCGYCKSTKQLSGVIYYRDLVV